MWVTCFVNLKNIFSSFLGAVLEFLSSTWVPDLGALILALALCHDRSGACNCGSAGGTAGTWAANLGCESKDGLSSGHCVMASVCVPASSSSWWLPMKGSKVHLQIPRWNSALRAKHLSTGVSAGEGVYYPPNCQGGSGQGKGLERLWWSHLDIWNACRPSWCIGLITKDHRGPWTPRTPVGTSVLIWDLNPVSSYLIKWSSPGIVDLLFYCELFPCTQCNGRNPSRT